MKTLETWKTYLHDVADECGHVGPWQQWAENGLSKTDREELAERYGDRDADDLKSLGSMVKRYATRHLMSLH